MAITQRLRVNSVSRKAALITGLVLLLVPGIASATSNLSRKYGVGCGTCHLRSAFPRLNYAGEQFQRNGLQDIGTQDGDETGKTKIGDELFLDDLGNLLGVRLNVVPVAYQTNVFQSKAGEYEDRVKIGNPDWMQLFTAGSIAKNISIFIETEFSTEGTFHNSWFRLGFHNLFGTGSGAGLANVWLGLQNPVELHAANGRLPMIPAARGEVFYVRSSNGKGDDSVSIRGGRPGASFYGRKGPIVYQLGIDSAKLNDPNVEKNGWATLRAEATGGPLEGSSVSGWYYLGTDSKAVIDTSGAIVMTRYNRFRRASVAANLRVKDVDATAAYVLGEDGNWALADPPSATTTGFDGWFVQVGYSIGPRWHLSAQYDRIDSEDHPEIRFNKASAQVSYAPRENLRLMLVPRFDLRPEDASHPKKQHEGILMVRTMF